MRFGLALVSAVIAALAVTNPAAASLLITIDKSTQRMQIALDGLTVFDWPVSTGKRGYDTPAGEFKPFRMARHHFSREWDDAPMPHSVFFTKRGHAIHGTNQLKAIGQPASHGCVRLAPGNAELLFKLVKQEGMANTRVVLHGETPAPALAAAPPGSTTEDFTSALPPRQERADRDGPAFFDGRYYYDRRGRRYSGPAYREPPRTYRAPPRYYRDREYYADRDALPFWWGR